MYTPVLGGAEGVVETLDGAAYTASAVDIWAISGISDGFLHGVDDPPGGACATPERFWLGVNGGFDNRLSFVKKELVADFEALL